MLFQTAKFFEDDAVLMPQETTWFGYYLDGAFNQVLPPQEDCASYELHRSLYQKVVHYFSHRIKSLKSNFKF